MKPSLEDLRFMDAALAQGYSGLGSTAPNPSVGCIIVKQGRVVGTGVTAPGGRPHAETQALSAAGKQANGATCYVTLEPCAHHGQTPPCAEALIQAGIARVVIACEDPFHAVDGDGISMMDKAGIIIDLGVRQSEAQHHHAGFFTRLETGQPILETDPREGLYDADLSLQPGEGEEEALIRLGHDGLTRIRRTE